MASAVLSWGPPPSRICSLVPSFCLKGVRGAELHGRCEDERALVPVAAGLSVLLYIRSGTRQGIS